MKHRLGVRRAHALDNLEVRDVARDRLDLDAFHRLGKRAIEQGDAADRLAAQLPAREQRARELEAEKAAAARDQNFHAAILAKNASTSASARVCFIGGRLARTARP